MKRFLLGAAGLAALGMTSPVFAADLAAKYTKAPALVAPIYNWTGFYVGGHIGVAVNGGISGTGVGINNSDGGRFLGGAQIGADYQFANNAVLGIQAQYSWLDSNIGVDLPVGAGFTYINNQRALGSVTGRLGYSFGSVLIYGKGGYAYSDGRDSVTSAGLPVAFSFDHGRRNGFTVGAGLEYMFTQNWSGLAEYQYYDFGHRTFVTPAPLAGTGFNNNEHTFKVGLNYRFGWAGPVVARY
jgi:outer membrane immunogenic protein